MGQTSIQWTDRSVNPIRFGGGHYCQKISPGCANCYASRMQPRFQSPAFKGTGGPLPLVLASPEEPIHERLWLDESKLAEVLRRRKPTKWFWCDMTDLFGEWVPDEWIDRCFAVMALTPQHTHQVLTKRPERMAEYMGTRGYKAYNDVRIETEQWPARNIHLGVSVEDQQRADERIPLLLQTPAAVRFLSVEPLLGPVDLKRLHFDDCEYDATRGENVVGNMALQRGGPKVDWVIIGGESGPGARPCDLAWVRSLVAQCRAAHVACFVKQLGARPFDAGGPALPMVSSALLKILDRKKNGDNFDQWPADLRVREFPRA